MTRHFRPPRTVEEQDACFVVRDHNGQALSYFISRMSRADDQRPSCSARMRREGLRRMFSLLTWRILTLRFCVGAGVNDFGSWRKRRRRCCECGSWRRRGRVSVGWLSRRMHGRNHAVTPAMFAHIKMRRLRKFRSCFAFRHAGWRAISQ
jgi:hypothetical protein